MRHVSTGRTGPNAGVESFGSGEARHQNETAFDGAILCEGDAVRF